MNRSIIIAVFAFFLVVLNLHAADDWGVSVKSGELWKLPKDEIVKKYLMSKKYSNIDQNRMRILTEDGITIGGLSPRELELTWKDDHLESVCVMVYNKGDDGPVDKVVFDKKLADAVKALETVAGMPGKAKKVPKREVAVEIKAWEWALPDDGGVIVLESSCTRKKKSFTAEFIKLTMGCSSEAVERGDARDALNRSKLKGHIVKEDSAVRIEGIPMVDQGQKGYCVPATASRVFAYYGMDGVDQHALAALCGSSGASGTSPLAMLEALKEIGSKFHVKIEEIDKRDAWYSWIEAYDKIAKKMKAKMLGAADPSSAWNAADREILRKTRAGKPNQVEKWMKPIRKNIDQGVPVLWSVELGIFDEPVYVPQSRGGHMRLIIGYDNAKKTIFFSDSWGARHELKEMPAADACAMTKQRYVLKLSR